MLEIFICSLYSDSLFYQYSWVSNSSIEINDIQLEYLSEVGDEIIEIISKRYCILPLNSFDNV